MIQERYTLVLERLSMIGRESFRDKGMEDFFHQTAAFLLKLAEKVPTAPGDGGNSQKADQEALCADLLAPFYQESYADPAYAASKLGQKWGRLFSCLYLEMKSAAFLEAEEDLQPLLIRMELFAEIYALFVYEWAEEQRLPAYEEVRQVLYWYAWDYMEDAAERLLRKLSEGKGLRGEPLSILYDGWLWEEKRRPEGKWKVCLTDHREDRGLFLDRPFVSRQLEVCRQALEKYRGKLPGPLALKERMAGEELWPAAGEEALKPEAIHMEQGQRQLWEKYCRSFLELSEHSR